MINLDNIFRECRELDAEECEGRVTAFVAAMTSSGEVSQDWDSVRPMLRAVLLHELLALHRQSGAP